MNFESKRKMKGKVVVIDGENEAGSSNASTSLFILEEFTLEKFSKREFKWTSILEFYGENQGSSRIAMEEGVFKKNKNTGIELVCSNEDLAHQIFSWLSCHCIQALAPWVISDMYFVNF